MLRARAREVRLHRDFLEQPLCFLVLRLEEERARELELHARTVGVLEHCAEDRLGAREISRLLRLHCVYERPLQCLLVRAGGRDSSDQQGDEDGAHRLPFRPEAAGEELVAGALQPERAAKLLGIRPIELALRGACHAAARVHYCAGEARLAWRVSERPAQVELRAALPWTVVPLDAKPSERELKFAFTVTSAPAVAPAPVGAT